MIALEYQLQRFHDFNLLQHFMIIYKDNGACIFYHPFKEDEISSDLISGFISAMSSMYGEFTGDGTQESIESLKYQGMNLDGFSGDHIIGILISEGKMTTSFDLADFIKSFESEYEDVLIEWRGLMKLFDHDWIVRTFFDSIDYYNNLPFVVSLQKPETKQYRKVVDFLRILRDRQGKFLIRKVLPGLQKFLNMSEAYVLDVLMMMKKKGIISYAPLEGILESSDESKALIENISSGVIAYDLIDKEETDSMEISEHPETEGISDDANQRVVRVTDDGSYSLKLEMSLEVIMRHSGDTWLREIISDAVELELGKRVVVSDPQYIPLECNSERGTIWVRVTFSNANQ